MYTVTRMKSETVKTYRGKPKIVEKNVPDSFSRFRNFSILNVGVTFMVKFWQLSKRNV